MAYWVWISLGLGLAVVELFVPTFVILWLGVAGIIVGLLLLLISMSLTVQIVLWALLSVALVVAWHKIFSPRMKDRTLAGMSKEALIGQVGTVLSFSVAEQRGKLRFSAPIVGEDEWLFLSDCAVTSGDRVKVTGISGNTLIVATV